MKIIRPSWSNWPDPPGAYLHYAEQKEAHTRAALIFVISIAVLYIGLRIYQTISARRRKRQNRL